MRYRRNRCFVFQISDKEVAQNIPKTFRPFSRCQNISKTPKTSQKNFRPIKARKGAKELDFEGETSDSNAR